MPLVIKGLVRVIQRMGRSKEACGEFLFKAIYRPEYKAGFHLLNEYGEAGGKVKVTSLHGDAKASVWDHTKKVLANLGSAAAK